MANMELRKERNFINAYDRETGKFLGAFDFKTGNYIGMRHRVLATFPNCFKEMDNPVYDIERKLRNEEMGAKSITKEEILQLTIFKLINWFGHHAHNLSEERLQFIESCASVGIVPKNSDATLRGHKLDKNFINFMRETQNTIFYDPAIAVLYDHKNEYENIINDENLPLIFRNLEFLSKFSNLNISFTLLHKLLKRVENEKIYYSMDRGRYDESRVMSYTCEFIIDYVQLSNELYDKVEDTQNILSKMTIMRYLKEMKRNEIYTKNLQENNNNPRLYYEDDNVIIKPLLTVDDFIDEANQQNNCVKNIYMNKAECGDCFIVHVRKKENLKHSYITCEVTKDFKIRQWLLANNRYPCVDSYEAQLQRIYQNHLNTWNA